MEAPMLTRLVLAVFALISFSFPAYAATDPIMPTYSCNELGATHMSDDRLGLVICALTTASYAPVVTCATGGGCTWKSMSAATGGASCAEMTYSGPNWGNIYVPSGTDKQVAPGLIANSVVVLFQCQNGGWTLISNPPPVPFNN